MLSQSSPPPQDASETIKGIMELLTNAEFIAGTDAEKAMVAANFVKSIGANGYIKLPGGLMIQWGSVTGSPAATGTVNFPTSFSTIYTVVLANSQDNRDTTHTSKSTSSFAYYTRTSSGTALGGTFDWVAIGKVNS